MIDCPIRPLQPPGKQHQLPRALQAHSSMLRYDSLPTVDNIVIPPRSQKLSIAPPGKPTDLGIVSPQFLHLVRLNPDVVVPDRAVPTARGDDGSIPRQ
jgi:hypothetical protein